LHPSTYNQSKESTLENLKILNKYGVTPLIVIHTTPNPINPNESVITFNQPSWFFMNKLFYENENIMKYYRLQILKILTLMNSTNDNIESDVDRLIQIEKLFASVNKYYFVFLLYHFYQDTFFF
jgi:hypothetical protein